MRFSENVALLLAAAGARVAADTGELGDAIVVQDNPVGVVYKAVLPEEAWFKPAYPGGGNIQGEVVATAAADGVGVTFTIRLSNLPKEGGPFPYHLHVDPVPSDGNCTKTLAHLDPFIRGEATPCDPEQPATCQVGDLSGKWGDIIPDENGTFEQTYTDLYASTKEGIGAFFGNRSIVVHFPNKTRITCANFFQVEAGDEGDYSSASETSTLTPTLLPTTFETETQTFGIQTTGPEPDAPVATTLPNNVSFTGGSPAAPTNTGELAGSAANLKASFAGVVVLGAAAVALLI